MQVQIRTFTLMSLAMTFRSNECEVAADAHRKRVCYARRLDSGLRLRVRKNIEQQLRCLLGVMAAQGRIKPHQDYVSRIHPTVDPLRRAKAPEEQTRTDDKHRGNRYSCHHQSVTQPE